MADNIEADFQNLVHLGPEKTAGTKISVEQLLFFNRQLASMARLDLPLARGLKSLTSEVKDARFREVVETVQQDMEQGIPLQEALGRFPNIFSPQYLEILRAGESTGNLAQVLDELANYSEEMEDTRRKLLQAISYPIAVASVASVMIFFILFKAVPQFKSLLQRTGGENLDDLYFLTKFTFFLSDFLHNYALAIPTFFLALGGLGFLFVYVRNSIRQTDDYLLRMPVFGTLFRQVTLFKICRTLSDLLESGVSIIEALNLTSRTAGANRFRTALEDMRNSVENGERMSEQCRRSNVFPETMVWKLTMGEERGMLEESLDELSGYYKRELGISSVRIQNILEPFFLLLISGIVGLIVISLYIPLFRIGG